MERWNRATLPAVVCAAILGFMAVCPGAGRTEDRHRNVMGIVEKVDGTVVTVGNHSYDLAGVSIRGAQREGAVDVSALRGQTIEIVFRNGEIASVAVYRTLPQ